MKTTTMRTLTNLLIASLTAVLLCVPTLGHAQTLANSVTLSAAITGAQGGAVGQTRFQVSSTTNIVVGSYLWIDSETMLVTAVPASGFVDVARGQRGTNARAHANAARVIIIPAANVTFFLRETDPDYAQAGTRGTGQAAYSPWINTATATVWVCVPTGNSAPGSACTWRGTRTQNVVFNSIPTSF